MSFGAADPDLYNLADQYDGVAGPAPAMAAPEPMPAPEVQPVDTTGGLDNFDAGAAAQNLGAVGQPPPDAPALAADPGVAVAAAPVPEAAPVDPLSVAPPPPPALTGDPAKDQAANLQYQRDLTAHFGAREMELQKRAQGEHVAKAAKDLVVAQAAEEQRKKLDAARAERRAADQKQIDDFVTQRIAAHKDLEGADWADQHTGRALVATIAGAIAQGFSNVAMIQSGHAPTAENEGIKAVDRMIKHDYEVKKQRIASMSESLLEARHGYDTHEDNYRAAMNDLEADTAAKYKLAGLEAEHRLRMLGASDDDIKRNAFRANMLQQAAKAEGTVLNNEETHRDSRERSAATNKLAEAHLGLQERQIDATIADRRMAAGERRREFNERAADRKEKKAATTGENDPRIVRDPDTGEPMFKAATPRVVDKLADQIAASRAYRRKAEEFAAHIEKYGRIYNPLSEEGKERASLAADLQAQGRQVSGLQASDSGQKLEHELVGGSGILAERMASPKRLRELSTEAATRLEQHLRATGTPIEGAKPNLGGKSDAAGPTPKQRAAMEKLAKEYGLTPVDE